MFTALRRLHYGALRQSIDGAARQPEPRSSKDDGVESGELLRIFRRLGDEQRKALILAVQAAEICDCQIDTIRSRVLEARREISVILREASLEKFELLAEKRPARSPMPSVPRRSWRRQKAPHKGGPVLADRALQGMGTNL